LWLIPSLSKRRMRDLAGSACLSALDQFLSMLHFSIWDLHFPINHRLISLTWPLWSVKYLQHFWIQSRVLQQLTSEWQSDQPTHCRWLLIHAGKLQDQGWKGMRELLNPTHLKIRKQNGRQCFLDVKGMTDERKMDVQDRYSCSWRRKLRIHGKEGTEQF